MYLSGGKLGLIACGVSLLLGCGGTGSPAGSAGGTGADTGGAGDTPVLGSAGSQAVPSTSNTFVDQIRQGAPRRIDLLLTIDNSGSMADKQALLQAAVPVLVGRLVSPPCVDSSGAPTATNVDATGKCAVGTPEFAPVNDIHVGLVTSSLGSHGGTVCAAPPPSGTQDNPLNDNANIAEAE